MTTIFAAIAGVATIVGGVVYLVSTGVWAFKKPTAAKEQDIDKEVSDEKHAVQDGARPKWD